MVKTYSMASMLAQIVKQTTATAELSCDKSLGKKPFSTCSGTEASHFAKSNCYVLHTDSIPFINI